MPEDIMDNVGSWSLIEALDVSATSREKAQRNVFMPALFLLANTMNLNQSTPNSFNPLYQSALSRTLLRFCGTTFVETVVFPRAFQNNSLCKIWGANRVHYGQLENRECPVAFKLMKSQVVK